ncbi:glycosyltransferase [Algoriphagus pacificus]|uniref:Glycosyltransferase n=1 Tax=Algoriphagus pacificus TaxID=2811234 RepID=A0ABS3CIN4_9BACT|nr:glycosyltransferase [Algoriphagus pacificus]MBN7816356.1 glycosyltransferase [Algoriphagus pacificus]
MKVIHFIASIDKNDGGTTAYIQLLSSAISSKIELIIATGKTANPVQIPNVKVVFFEFSLWVLPRLKNNFLKLIEYEKPDIVHINGIWTPQNWLFQKVAQELGIKVILSPHGMLEPYILARNPWKKKLALFLYQDTAIRSADYIHVTASSELNQIRNLGYKQDSFVIPNGINLSEVRRKKDFRSIGEPLRILFLSRIHPKKGIEVLLEALALRKIPDFKLKICGTGEESYISSLKKKTSDLELNKKVFYPGAAYEDLKWDLFCWADIFVLPTYSENFGIVVAEALAVGIPVITTTETPWQELELNGCGWWIKLSKENLAKTLKIANELSPEQLKEMGKRGVELIEKKYEINFVAEAFLEAYKKKCVKNN